MKVQQCQLYYLLKLHNSWWLFCILYTKTAQFIVVILYFVVKLFILYSFTNIQHILSVLSKYCISLSIAISFFISIYICMYICMHVASYIYCMHMCVCVFCLFFLFFLNSFFPFYLFIYLSFFFFHFLLSSNIYILFDNSYIYMLVKEHILYTYLFYISWQLHSFIIIFIGQSLLLLPLFYYHYYYYYIILFAVLNLISLVIFIFLYSQLQFL